MVCSVNLNAVLRTSASYPGVASSEFEIHIQSTSTPRGPYDSQAVNEMYCQPLSWKFKSRSRQLPVTQKHANKLGSDSFMVSNKLRN